MSSYHRCTKCNSDQMIDGAFVAGAQGPRVVVGVEHHPDKGRLTHVASTQIHASICGSCGYVELYANRPDELNAAYQSAGQEHQTTASRA